MMPWLPWSSRVAAGSMKQLIARRRMGRWLSVSRGSDGGQQDAFRALGRFRSGLEGEGQHCLSCLALYRGQRGTLVSAGGLSPVDEVQSQNLVNAEISAENPAFGSVCTSGGGPGLQNQWRV